MTVLSIGFEGEEMELKVKLGATFGPVTAQMVNPDLSPVNLTGSTIRGKIRDVVRGTEVTAFDVTITNAATGLYEFGLTKEKTLLLGNGKFIDEWRVRYVWDFELLDSLGREIPLYWGDVIVRLEVTRA